MNPRDELRRTILAEQRNRFLPDRHRHGVDERSLIYGAARALHRGAIQFVREAVQQTPPQPLYSPFSEAFTGGTEASDGPSPAAQHAYVCRHAQDIKVGQPDLEDRFMGCIPCWHVDATNDAADDHLGEAGFEKLDSRN